MKIPPAATQTDALSIPAEPLGPVAAPAANRVHADLGEQLPALYRFHVIEEAQSDHRRVDRNHADARVRLDRFRVDILSAGSDRQAPDARLLYHVGRIELAKFPRAKAMIERQHREPVRRLASTTFRPLTLCVHRRVE